MTIDAAMKSLEAAGTAQNRKVYGRHGVKGTMFGVSFAHLKTLTKKIKCDHELAEKLWASGNHDARVLATMIADPAKISNATLDAWARTLDNYVIADAFAGFVAKTEFARSKADKWGKAANDHISQAGWNIVTHIAMYDSDCPQDYLADKLAVIEKDIHRRKNRTRHAMNMALCGIGIGCEGLRKQAIAAAQRIGKVEVDHGETSCQTPDAVSYIEKAAQRGTPKKRVRTC